MHASIHPCMHASIQPYIHKYIHRYIRTFINTTTNTSINTSTNALRPLCGYHFSFADEDKFRRRIAKTNSPKTNCSPKKNSHPKTNSEDELSPEDELPPKVNSEDEFPEEELGYEHEVRKRIPPRQIELLFEDEVLRRTSEDESPRRQILKTNSPKTNCARKTNPPEDE